MKLTFVFALLLLSMPLTAGERVTSVPKQFIGNWGSNRADCGSVGDVLSLQIREAKIIYYNSSGPLQAIVTHGQYELALIAELSGEGQTWLATEHFSLSKNGTELINQTPPKTVRYRCKRGRAA